MNNTSLKNTPKLRFSEFHDEWVFKELKQIAYKRTEKNRENLYSTVLTNSAVRGVVAQEDYFDRDIVSEGNTDGYYVVKENNFVYNPRVSKHAKVGPIKRNTYKTGIMSPLYTIFEFKEGDLDFFEHYFTSHYWHRYMQSISNIGARHDRMNVHDSEFLKIPLPYPDVNEQQKIAGFLTAVDDRISAMQEKVELLKNYKKGIMQKIFSQEIRFKDENGNDFPKWEDIKAGEIFNNYINKNHSGDLPLLAVTQDNGVVNRDDLDLKINSSEKGIQGYKIIEPGNFVISLRSFQGGIELSTLRGISSPAYTILENILPINKYYYKAYFKRESFISKLNALIYGIRDGKQISYSEFKTMDLPYPHIDEQNKIGDFLISIDDKIQLEERRLAEAKKFKKSLLQQMFV